MDGETPEDEGPLRQFVRCRLFQEPGHSTDPEALHGLSLKEAWVVDAIEVANLWTESTNNFHMVGNHHMQLLVRRIQQVGEDLACLIEVEGEKTVWRNLFDDAPPSSYEAAHRSRSLKFLVDAQLDLITSLGHLVVNLAAQTIAAHPRWRTVDLSHHSFDNKTQKLLDRLATEPAGNSSDSDWLNANVATVAAITEMANLTGDQMMIDLAGAVRAIATKAPDWRRAIRHRGERHHRDKRSLPVGMDEIPEEPINGGAYGGRGARFFGADAPIDTDHAARTRIAVADELATKAVQQMPTAMKPLYAALAAAIMRIEDPEHLSPWASPSSPIPRPSENGSPFPYHLYLEITTESWKPFMDARLELPDHMWCHPEFDSDLPPTIHAVVWVASYEEADDQITSELAAHRVVVKRTQPALLW